MIALVPDPVRSLKILMEVAALQDQLSNLLADANRSTILVKGVLLYVRTKIDEDFVIDEKERFDRSVCIGLCHLASQRNRYSTTVSESIEVRVLAQRCPSTSVNFLYPSLLQSGSMLQVISTKLRLYRELLKGPVLPKPGGRCEWSSRPRVLMSISAPDRHMFVDVTKQPDADKESLPCQPRMRPPNLHLEGHTPFLIEPDGTEALQPQVALVRYDLVGIRLPGRSER